MSDFIRLKKAVQEQFSLMSKHDLFKTKVSKDDIWEMYLKSFPDGTNPIFRERTTHDCNCCRQFIKACGNVVAVIEGKSVSIWDVNVGGYYQDVADAMSKLVKEQSIDNVFLNPERVLGTDKNRELTDDGGIINWDHFHYELPSKFVEDYANIGTILSKKLSAKNVFLRGVSEITINALETAIELIGQNSLYRGQESMDAVETFLREKVAFEKVATSQGKDLFAWVRSAKIGGLSMFRNSAIGTLLVDMSSGVDLSVAVGKFEAMVAPKNYKRSTALVSKGMIDRAEKRINELRIADSLVRRFATINDITVNNILYVDRDSKMIMNVFDEMRQSASTKVQNLDKMETVSIQTFIDNILPKAESVEVLFENSHLNNLMSLIAPVYPDAPPILKWDNNFSWSYSGEVTDSIKERVKKAGGTVSGVLRCSLSWFNYDDLDIHVIEPDGNHIEFGNKGRVHTSSGILDVDMNVPETESRDAVENIIWTDKSRMQEGTYKLYVNNYTQREDIDLGFDVEIEYGGVTHSFNYPKKVRNGESITVAEFTFSRKSGIKFISSLPQSTAVKEEWGLTTSKFHKVKMVMNSPNHWDGNKIGNKHWFFIIDNCSNPKEAKGFFNEFLDNKLKEHRKVLEVLSTKTNARISDDQLSGLGFSSTMRNHLVCKVSGSFSRTIKINF